MSSKQDIEQQITSIKCELENLLLEMRRLREELSFRQSMSKLDIAGMKVLTTELLELSMDYAERSKYLLKLMDEAIYDS